MAIARNVRWPWMLGFLLAASSGLASSDTQAIPPSDNALGYDCSITVRDRDSWRVECGGASVAVSDVELTGEAVDAAWGALIDSRERWRPPHPSNRPKGLRHEPVWFVSKRDDAQVREVMLAAVGEAGPGRVRSLSCIASAERYQRCVELLESILMVPWRGARLLQGRGEAPGGEVSTVLGQAPVGCSYEFDGRLGQVQCPDGTALVWVEADSAEEAGMLGRAAEVALLRADPKSTRPRRPCILLGAHAECSEVSAGDAGGQALIAAGSRGRRHAWVGCFMPASFQAEPQACRGALGLEPLEPGLPPARSSR